MDDYKVRHCFKLSLGVCRVKLLDFLTDFCRFVDLRIIMLCYTSAFKFGEKRGGKFICSLGEWTRKSEDGKVQGREHIQVDANII